MKKVLKPAAGIGAGVGAVLLYGVVAGDIIVKSDPGGDIRALYQQYWDEYDDGRNRHVIDGRCASACTMRLAFPNTCVTPNARLGFHKAYYVSFFGWKIGSPWGTQYMAERWPDRIRARIEPVLSHEMTWLDSEEAVELGVKAC